MEPNQNDKSSQPVDSKSTQPTSPEVKKEETNANAPTATPAKQPERVQPVPPITLDNEKISDVPDTKDPKEEVVKAETTGDAASVEDKKAL